MVFPLDEPVPVGPGAPAEVVALVIRKVGVPPFRRPMTAAFAVPAATVRAETKVEVRMIAVCGDIR